MRPLLHILTGPTAVGKTELALAWAEHHRAEIVSCDASLFYQGMDLGTAKPTPAELARVPHHLIDVCSVRERMDITRYVGLARVACAAIAARGRPVLVTGGSGFYLKAFIAPVADDIETPPDLRAELSARLAAGGPPGSATATGLADLLAELRSLNPDGIGSLDTQNPRRVQRALERCRASGRTLADLAAAFAARPGPFADWDARIVVLERPPEDLRRRVETRAAAMLRAGLIEEVCRLRAEGIADNPSAASAIGYRETLAALHRAEHAGTPLDPSALAAEIALNTWGLVRRQRTWLRTQLPPALVRTLPAAEASPATLFAPP